MAERRCLFPCVSSSFAQTEREGLTGCKHALHLRKLGVSAVEGMYDTSCRTEIVSVFPLVAGNAIGFEALKCVRMGEALLSVAAHSAALTVGTRWRLERWKSGWKMESMGVGR